MGNHLLLAVAILFANALAFAHCELSLEGGEIFKSIKLVTCSHDPTAYCIHAEEYGGRQIQDRQRLFDCANDSCFFRGEILSSRLRIFCEDDLDELDRPLRICDGSRDFFEILSADRQTKYAKCEF